MSSPATHSTRRSIRRRSKSTPQVAAASQAAALLLALCPRVMQTVRRRLHEERFEGVTITQQRILRYVAVNPGVSLSELAANFMVSAPSASTTVNRLARQRLLRVRTPADNRRRIAVTLTAAGQAVVDRSVSLSQREVQVKLQSISKASLRRMAPVLRTLLSSFQ